LASEALFRERAELERMTAGLAAFVAVEQFFRGGRCRPGRHRQQASLL